MKLKFTLLLILFLTGCSTVGPSKGVEPSDEQEGRIDILGLERHLGMERTSDDLGYEEKVFDTCNVGYGFSSTHNCRKVYLVVVHFQLLCRNTDGTAASVSSYFTTPFSSDRIVWRAGSRRGSLATDGEGLGQFRLLAPRSYRREKVRLTVSGKFLVTSAGDLTKVVAPASWCN